MPSHTITILEYQSHWRSDFEQIASDLKAVLQRDALEVDHIGSTAIQGLCAKDIIDVQVTVHTLDESIAQKLLQAEFTTHTDMWRQDHLPPGFRTNAQEWKKLFFMQRPGARRSNIHIRQVGSPNQRYPLLVRDFLRHDARAAEAYGRLKRQLAENLADPDTYPDVKDPASDLIYLAAERWAAYENWQQAPAGAE
jgi:GrpB-like predicted nucleotidyltransferase (UPF0157 family)